MTCLWYRTLKRMSHGALLQVTMSQIGVEAPGLDSGGKICIEGYGAEHGHEALATHNSSASYAGDSARASHICEGL
jgi:hypothetical protein